MQCGEPRLPEGAGDLAVGVGHYRGAPDGIVELACQLASQRSVPNHCPRQALGIVSCAAADALNEAAAGSRETTSSSEEAATVY